MKWVNRLSMGFVVAAMSCGGTGNTAATGDGAMGGDMVGSSQDLTQSTDGPPGDASVVAGPTLVSLGTMASPGAIFNVGAAGTPAAGKAFFPDGAGSVHVVDVATRAETVATNFFAGRNAQATDIAPVGTNIVGCWTGAPAGTSLYAAAFGANGFGTPTLVAGAKGCHSATAIPGGTLLAVSIRDGNTLATSVGLFDSASAYAAAGSVATTGLLGPMAASATTIAGFSGRSSESINFIDVAAKGVLGTFAIYANNGLSSSSLSFDAGGATLYASNGVALDAITVATRTLSGTIPSDALALGTGAGFVFSADGKYVVFGGYDAQGKEALQVHRVSDGMTTQSLRLTAPGVSQIRRASDGTVIVLVADQGVSSAQFYSFQ